MTSRRSSPKAGPIQRVAEQLKNGAANVMTLRRIAGWLASRPRRGATVAERLGYDAKARLLIINAEMTSVSAMNRTWPQSKG